MCGLDPKSLALQERTAKTLNKQKGPCKHSSPWNDLLKPSDILYRIYIHTSRIFYQMQIETLGSLLRTLRIHHNCFQSRASVPQRTTMHFPVSVSPAQEHQRELQVAIPHCCNRSITRCRKLSRCCACGSRKLCIEQSPYNIECALSLHTWNRPATPGHTFVTSGLRA